MVNSFICKLLKRLFNQPRPKGAAQQGLPDPGMPSSHAHMLFFLSSYLSFALQPPEWALSAGSGALFVALGSCVHRVASGKHTLAQVAVLLYLWILLL